MPPEHLADLRFYGDESILGVAKALTIVRDDMVHPGHGLIPQIPTGTLDPDWMPVVASMNLVVIARDRHIRTKPAELRIFRDHGLRVFWITGKRDLTSWGKLLRLVARWNDMERVIATRGAGPWLMGIGEHAIAEIPVP